MSTWLLLLRLTPSLSWQGDCHSCWLTSGSNSNFAIVRSDKVCWWVPGNSKVLGANGVFWESQECIGGVLFLVDAVDDDLLVGTDTDDTNTRCLASSIHHNHVTLNGETDDLVTVDRLLLTVTVASLKCYSGALSRS